MPKRVSNVTISTTAQLMTALSTARAGDVIYLNPGTYSGVSMDGFSFNGTVTITSKDATQRAVFTDLKVTNSAGLTFSGLEFSFPDGNPAAYGICVIGSQNIHFLNDKVHGTLNNDPTSDMSGFQILRSTNVSVETSELQQLRNGVVESNSSYISILKNNFHDIRIDGVDNAGSSNVTISGNNFSHFRHLAGDHPDAIQFWNTGQTTTASNIAISGNVIVQSETGRGMQGVFMANEAGLALAYKNVDILNNVVIGGFWNGVYVDQAYDLNISGNTLTTLSGQMTSVLKVFDSDVVTVSNNSAAMYGLNYNNTNLTSTGNVTSSPVSDSGLAVLTSWLSSHPRTVGSGPASASTLIGDEPDAVSSSGNYLMGEMSHSLTLTGTANIVGYGNDNGVNITGNSGANTLTGGMGADRLNGGGGADVLVGGKGADTLTGGAGIDVFVFTPGDGADAIADFGSGGADRIDISGHLGDGGVPVVALSGSDTVISFANGDSITLTGVSPLHLLTTGTGFTYI